MWIHGGGYRRGLASRYGVRHLVNKKTVVVTIQYRLGSLGEAYYRLLRNGDRRQRITIYDCSYYVWCFLAFILKTEWCF